MSGASSGADGVAADGAAAAADLAVRIAAPSIAARTARMSRTKEMRRLSVDIAYPPIARRIDRGCRAGTRPPRHECAALKACHAVGRTLVKIVRNPSLSQCSGGECVAG